MPGAGRFGSSRIDPLRSVSEWVRVCVCLFSVPLTHSHTPHPPHLPRLLYPRPPPPPHTYTYTIRLYSQLQTRFTPASSPVPPPSLSLLCSTHHPLNTCPDSVVVSPSPCTPCSTTNLLVPQSSLPPLLSHLPSSSLSPYLHLLPHHSILPRLSFNSRPYCQPSRVTFYPPPPPPHLPFLP